MLPITSSRTNDENHFFDRVKHTLDNRETYNEFLKLVNLFTQDYIDTATLIKQSRSFLADGELMRQFKDILGWNERKERESYALDQHRGEPKRPSPRGILDRRSRADLNVSYGSYRKLPATVSLFLH
jgi:paired amphipathic helix protein Sin3a